MSYRQLSIAERKEIEFYQKQRNYSLRTIAKIMGRSVSTISREIQRNKMTFSGEYEAERAKHKAYVRKKYCKFQISKIMADMKLREYIETQLRENWSPMEVAGRIGQEFGLGTMSKTAIYEYLRSVHGQMLAFELDLHRIKKRAKRTKEQKERMKLEDRIFIDQRPTSINERLHYGDYEGDFIVSGKNGSGALLVLHERKSRFVLIRKIEERNIEEVHRVMARMLRPIRNLSSLTLDNDIAFRRHKELSEILKAPIYFCHPYHSWEKGGVEFSNRLIREYIPKGTDISQIDEDTILEMEVRLNNRPRKILGFKTPLEIMKENNQFFGMFDGYPCTTKPLPPKTNI